jgi:hypothetical protein
MGLPISQVRLRSGMSQLPTVPVNEILSSLLVPLCQDPASSIQTYIKASADDITKSRVIGLATLPVDTVGDLVSYVSSGIIEVNLSYGTIPAGSIIILGMNGALEFYQSFVPGQSLSIIATAVESNVLQVAINNTGVIMANPALVGRPAAYVANQNDLDWFADDIVLISSTMAINITGVVARADGFQRIVRNIGAFNITFKNQDVLSVAANRLVGPGAVPADVIIGPGDTLSMIYLAGTLNRWVMV